MTTHHHLAKKVIKQIEARKKSRRNFLLLGLGVGAGLAGIKFWTEPENKPQTPMFTYIQKEGPSLVYFKVNDNGF